MGRVLMTAALCAALTGQVTFAAPAAEVVMMNGAIYTVDAQRSWAEALAIEGGKLTYVGTSAGAKAFIGTSTRIIDLKGAYVQPGMVDMHVHPVMGGIKALYECNFAFTATPQEVAKAIAACAAKTPQGAWIRGGQWGSGFFQQNKIDSPRAFLDKVSGNHPVFLNDDSAHNGWANSAALEAARIDAKTADPEGGKILRETDGRPNGVLVEGAARLFDKIIPDWTPQQYRTAAQEAARLANGYGITSIKDAGAPFGASGLAFPDLDAAGKLTLNVAICIPTPYGARTAALDYAALEATRAQYKTPHVSANFVKIFLDGVPTPARTAAMIHPYVADDAHGANYTGDLHVAQALLDKDVTELDKRGFTVKMHAAGDRSVRVALNAIEAARKANGSSGLHHEVAHASFIDPTDVPRFAKLDAIPDYSPIIWYPSPITQAVFAAVGKERGEHFWPTRDLLDSGAKVAAGSDWPAAVPDENPWGGVEALVTRADPQGKSPGTLWKEQAITLAEALQIYTINGARALRLEKQTGSIEVGKSADLIVLDRNLFRVPINEVSETRVRSTWFEGKVVAGTAP